MVNSRRNQAADQASESNANNGPPRPQGDTNQHLALVLTTIADRLEVLHGRMPAMPPQGGEREPQMDRTVELFQKMRPPHFEGIIDSASVEKWIGSVEKAFDSFRCPANRKVALAISVLDGAADDWWKDHRRIFFNEKELEDITWNEFLETFRQQYIPQSARDKMREELARLTQRDMTVHEYEAKFNALAKFTPQMIPNEKEKCYLFRKGLRDSIRTVVLPFQHQVYSELVNMASLVEQDQLIIQNRRQAAAKRKGGASKSYSGPAPKKFHPSTGPSNSGGRTSMPQCSHCGKYHWGQCRLLKTCYTCGETGHISPNCTRKVTPTATPIAPASVASTAGGRGGGSTASSGGRGRYTGGRGAQPRIYALTQQEAQESPDVITGTGALNHGNGENANQEEN